MSPRIFLKIKHIRLVRNNLVFLLVFLGTIRYHPFDSIVEPKLVFMELNAGPYVTRYNSNSEAINIFRHLNLK